MWPGFPTVFTICALSKDMNESWQCARQLWSVQALSPLPKAMPTPPLTEDGLGSVGANLSRTELRATVEHPRMLSLPGTLTRRVRQ